MEGLDPWCSSCISSRLESLGGTLAQAAETTDAIARVENTISALLRAEETGAKAPDWNHITVDSGGLTYGAFQADRKSGELAAMLRRYLADPDARHARSMGPYVRALSRGERWPDGSADFKRILRAAGSDPAMQRAQSDYFREHHLRPGMADAAEAGLRSPLGAALWLDLKVNGGLDSVVADARRRVGSIRTPGDETRFIRAMLDAREARYRALARKSSHRAYLQGWLSRNGDFRRLLDAGQQDLAGEVRVASKGFSICGGSREDARAFERNQGAVATR